MTSATPAARSGSRLAAVVLPRVTVAGIILGTLFFIASLTPSLVPRGTLIQGVLSGFSFAAGYGLGRGIGALWLLLQAPKPSPVLFHRLFMVVAAVCAVLAGAALWHASAWQNGLRALMDLPPVDTLRMAGVALLAAAVFVVLLLLARLVLATSGFLSRRIGRVLPGPQAMLLAVFVTALIFWNIGNGVVVRGAMAVLDSAYASLDAFFEESSPQPTDPLKAGGPGSLLAWEDLGRAGREMVAAGPDRDEIARLAGGPALEPLRVYVGLNAAPDHETRAALALKELIRIGAFDRGTLVIATPTGTGWIDPESQSALEYILRGDVATVSVQYSYLASWVALLADPDYGLETARAVFAAVYGHWHSLPPDDRPRLYLHGLSLGSYYSDLSHDNFQVISDPYNGAFWAGPPFPSRTWNTVTRDRDAGTPAWLPAFRDGAVVRFHGPDGGPIPDDAPWGSFRILYLQYASDAITFFDPAALWRKPAWMDKPRGPDVSPQFRWLPVVTFLQLGVDVMTAVAPPLGHGHNYRFDHYARGWVALLDPPGWDAEALASLIRAYDQARP